MRRRIVIRYSAEDAKQADGCRAKWAGLLKINFDDDDTSEPLISQAAETDIPALTGGEAKPQVSVLLIGSHTAEDTAVKAAVDRALARGESVLGVRLASGVAIPEALYRSGCELLDLDSDDLGDAFGRAALGIRRRAGIVEAAESATSTDEECARAPTEVVQGDHVPIPE